LIMKSRVLVMSDLWLHGVKKYRGDTLGDVSFPGPSPLHFRLKQDN
jgi:hypothetical protein